VPEIAVTPVRGVIGEPVTIDVKSKGPPLPSAVVTVTGPDNSFETYTTAASGKVTYTPASIGRYSVKVEKAKYTVVDKTFEVRNKLVMELKPANPKVGQEINLTLRNQLGVPVPDTPIVVDGKADLTDENGGYSFTLPEAKEYNISTNKGSSMYWDASKVVTPEGVMYLMVDGEAEIGDTVSVSLLDQDKKTTSGKIVVTTPEGFTQEITSETYTPKSAGSYGITATKPGYGRISKTLEVRPLPLDVSFTPDGSILRVGLTSHNTPIAGITVRVTTPYEREEISDEEGVVSFPIQSTGDYEIEVNTVGTLTEYESKIVSRKVKKSYKILWLLIPAAVIIAFVVVALLLIYLSHHRIKKEQGLGDKGDVKIKKAKKSSLSGL